MKDFHKTLGITFLAVSFSAAAINRMPQFIVITGLIAGALYFISKKVDRKMRTRVATLFLAAFFLQVLFSLYMYNETVNTKYYGFSYKGDDYVYGDFGTIVGDLWRRGIFPDLKRLKYYNLIGENIPVDGYQLYNAFIFFLFGSCGGQILLIMNCFFHAAIIIPVYFLCRNLGIENTFSTLVMSLFVFWPSIFYWSAFNFKEPMLLFGIFILFSLLITMAERVRIADILLLTIPLFMMWLTRRYIFFGVGFMLLFYSVFFYRWPYKRLIVLAGTLILISIQLFFKVVPADIYTCVPSKIFAIRCVGAASNTSYLTGFATATYFRTLLFLPVGILATIFLPFLLRPFSLMQVWTNVESIVWWALLPFLAAGLWQAAKNKTKKSFPLLFIFVYWLVTLALTEGSMGTLIRHKAILYCTGFIFIAIGIQGAFSAIRRSGGLNSLYISYNALTEPITQSQVLPYLAGLSKRGIKFYLLTYEKKKMTKQEKDRMRRILKERSAEGLEIEWFCLNYHKRPVVPATLFDVIAGFFYAIYIILKNRVDVVHARAVVAAMAGYPAAKILSKKFIFDTRGIDSEEYVDAGLWRRGGIKYRTVSFLESLITKSSDHIVVLTNKFLKVLQTRYGAYKLKYSVIPCAVDMDRFRIEMKDDAGLADKLNISGKFVFVYAGSIGTWYMLREMLSFFKCAGAMMRKTHFLILTQSDKALIWDMISEAGLDARSVTVTYVPHETMSRYMALCNAGIFFIKPVFSKISSSPTKFAEYLASGMPVIINSGIGDTEEMTRNNKIGVVVENFSITGYNRALRSLVELLKDPGLAERCRNTAEKHLSLEKAVEIYEGIYKNI